MDTLKLITDTLREVETSLPTVQWSTEHTAPADGSRFHKGKAPDGWTFIVGRIENNGAVGYDGAAARGGTVLHLTPSLAENAWKFATATKD